MTGETLVVDVSSDWAAACNVQQRSMRGWEPGRKIADYSALCRQMHALGGDCYDWARHGSQRLALTVGDASGHGLAAALMIANVQASLRTAMSFTGDDVAAALRTVNRQLHASLPEEGYATLFYGMFDAATRELRYVNAGHCAPVILRRDGSFVWLESGGAPVGMFPDWRYQAGVIQLERGDTVLAYTDGVIEAVNPSGEEWGTEGLCRAAAGSSAAHATGLVHAIFSSMDDFACGKQSDDATVAVLRVH